MCVTLLPLPDSPQPLPISFNPHYLLAPSPTERQRLTLIGDALRDFPDLVWTLARAGGPAEEGKRAFLCAKPLQVFRLQVLIAAHEWSDDNRSLIAGCACTGLNIGVTFSFLLRHGSARGYINRRCATPSLYLSGFSFS